MDFLQKDINVGALVWHKTSVLAKYFFEIFSENDLSKLSEIYQFSKQNNLEILFISGGTNILFARDFFDGIVIKNSLLGWEFDKKTKILSTFSAEKIWEIAENLEKNHNEPLWHRFIGLPGAIAGAVVGNAWCFGLETENNFVSAKIFDMETGEIFSLNKEKMQFSYRHSILKDQRNLFVISVIFDLSENNEKYASDVDNIDFRENKQPKGNSCGSFFKNPSKEFSAGFLIEKVGLKGAWRGGAMWSPLHANFLLANAHCKPEDLIGLIILTQEKVKSETGFDLVPEVRIIK